MKIPSILGAILLGASVKMFPTSKTAQMRLASEWPWMSRALHILAPGLLSTIGTLRGLAMAPETGDIAERAEVEALHNQNMNERLLKLYPNFPNPSSFWLCQRGDCGDDSGGW